MTKKELKTGMVVEYRSGAKRMVLLDTPIGNAFVGDDGWTDLDNYRDNLCHKFNKWIDVVAVYEPCCILQMAPSFWDNQECIWRRSEVKEVTLSEIAEKFGVSVENIRVKE